jgi:hypothetical protein
LNISIFAHSELVRPSSMRCHACSFWLCEDRTTSMRNLNFANGENDRCSGPPSDQSFDCPAERVD